jgi:hypothetical protein
MSIQTHDYEVSYTAVSQTLCLKGSLRLNASPEYQPISDLLDSAHADLVAAMAFDGAAKPVLKLDLRELKFLNSSGINLLYQFVLKVKKQGSVGLQVLGANSNAWQPKSLSNMVKFMPSLELSMS